MRRIALFILFGLIAACSRSPKEELEYAIDVAQTFLSQGQCQKAIDVLEDVSEPDLTHGVFLQVWASAYACRGGFDAIRFMASDLPSLETSAADLLKSLSIISTSEEGEADSQSYSDIVRALSILLQDSSEVAPSHSLREFTLGKRKAQDVGVQVLLVALVQLGKFTHYYGNVNEDGEKGEGPGSNSCFIDYTYPNAQTIVGANGGACTSFNDGHQELDFGGSNLANAKRRVCEALVAMTNFLDILNHLDLAESSTLEALEEVASTANQLRDNAIQAEPNLETLLYTTSQMACESLLDTPAQLNYMQLIMALLFEVALP